MNKIQISFLKYFLSKIFSLDQRNVEFLIENNNTNQNLVNIYNQRKDFQFAEQEKLKMGDPSFLNPTQKVNLHSLNERAPINFSSQNENTSKYRQMSFQNFGDLSQNPNLSKSFTDPSISCPFFLQLPSPPSGPRVGNIGERKLSAFSKWVQRKEESDSKINFVTPIKSASNYQELLMEKSEILLKTCGK